MGPVRIVGTGLLGASLGLRLRELGQDVQLEDTSPAAAALARDLGAGDIAKAGSPEPSLVIVATPPDVAAAVVCRALDAYPHALVTDVASVKEPIVREVEPNEGASRYVGSHPMAGRERSGAIAADADLFVGRPWVITPSAATSESMITFMKQFALEAGSIPIVMRPEEHDSSVALVSHLPQLVSSLVAGALRDAPSEALNLAGQGLRDVTRIARSDSSLWASIIAGNAGAVTSALKKVESELGKLITSLEAGIGNPYGQGVLAGVSRTILMGNEGVERIPGKHGGAPHRYAEVIVLIPDRPGELGRLFSEVGEIGVNIEDLQMEHSVNQRVGRGMLSVEPNRALELARGLERRGWQVVLEGREKKMGVVIALDGPSGSGKSTVSRRVAGQLGLAYLDTGAMYRAAAWWCMDRGINLSDQAAVTTAVRNMPLDMPLDPDNQKIVCAGADITQAIRTSDLSKQVSQVATNLDVRAEMKRRQRQIIAEATTGIIAEGRDITTVVAPDADVRVLLTASEEARLARRALEVRGAADTAALEATRDEVLRRDADDSTVSRFMTAEDGVTTIDSSALDIDQVVEAVISLIPEKMR
ncbi:prephenate dehydrogenase [Ancrocorticia populi]|uniref:prephenate dehydrogenase n=1 Tax=Ancrocorticia populi TaxID=2175228 RepID=UPI003F95CB87